MDVDLKKLAGDLLGVVRAAAPLVGLGTQAAAAETLVRSIATTVTNVKASFDSDDAETLGSELAALEARVNAHADRTTAALGGG